MSAPFNGPKLGWLDRIVNVQWNPRELLWVACVVRFDANFGIVVGDATATLNGVGGVFPQVTIHNPHTITAADLTTTTFFDQAWADPATLATFKVMRIFRVPPQLPLVTGSFVANIGNGVLGNIRVQLFRQEDILNASLDLSLADLLPVDARSTKGPVSGLDGLPGTLGINFTVNVAEEKLL